MNFRDEETANSWTRGDLTGEWALSRKDIDHIFGPDDQVSALNAQTKYEPLYGGRDTMLPHMTTLDAMKFNAVFRHSQEHKMRSLSWDTNMLNAYHNLHFILYMADMLPDFVHAIDDGKRTYTMDVPGRPMWILQLVMKAATECLRDDYIKVSRKNADAAYDHRISPIVADWKWFGIELHVVADAVISVMVQFEPRIKANGIFGCSYKVDLGCGTWAGDAMPISRVDTRLKKNMVAMRDYIRKELARFSKMLLNAEFNQPYNALFNLNANMVFSR